MKILISIILSSFLCLFPTIGNCQESSSNEQIQSSDIEKINIYVTITPIENSQYCYDFSTNDKNQINYIIHMLNSIDFVDDGKKIGGADIPIVNINLTKADNSIDNYGFVCGRFYDTNDKQYAVDTKEYNRFLDFIYALKTEKIVLDDEVTFEPSEWAKEDIAQTIENGLVPSLNQINYIGKINRLEVCQLIDNLLEKRNIAKNKSTENPFSDTADRSVINLYQSGIINGKSDSEFCPYDYITREEFASILKRACDLINNGEGIVGDEVMFDDQTEISNWAWNSVRFVTNEKIMIGDIGNKFRPKDCLTKQEAIIALSRLSNSIK